jgi:hypothetical protein
MLTPAASRVANSLFHVPQTFINDELNQYKFTSHKHENLINGDTEMLLKMRGSGRVSEKKSVTDCFGLKLGLLDNLIDRKRYIRFN